MTGTARASLLLAALTALGLLAACDTTGGPQPVPPSASRNDYTNQFVPTPGPFR